MASLGRVLANKLLREAQRVKGFLALKKIVPESIQSVSREGRTYHYILRQWINVVLGVNSVMTDEFSGLTANWLHCTVRDR